MCTWELYKKSRLVCWPSIAKDEVTTCLLTAYNSTVSSLLDKHAPIITKISNRKSKSNPWFSHPLRAFRTTLHHAESVYKRTHSALDWSTFKSLRNRYHHLILDSKKKQYFSKLVSSSSDNPRRLWQTVNKLLNRKSASSLPSSSAATSIADRFAHFFTDKISNLRLSLGNNSSCSSQHSPSAPVAPSDFSVLNLPPNRKCTRSYSIVLISSVILILSPTWLLKECASVIIPTITNIVNLSLNSNHFHPVLKKSVFFFSSYEIHLRQRATF